LKAPVYRFRLVLLIVLLFSHAQQNPKSLTYRLVQIMGSISVCRCFSPKEILKSPRSGAQNDDVLCL